MFDFDKPIHKTLEELLEALLQYGFLTGSQAFDTATEESDWDIVYPVHFSQEIDKILAGYVKVDSDYFAGYVVRHGTHAVNLIPVHPHEFKPWYLATKAMRSTLKLSGLAKEPIKKYSVFMGIVSLFKGTVAQLGTLKDYDTQIQEIIDRENEAPK